MVSTTEDVRIRVGDSGTGLVMSPGGSVNRSVGLDKTDCIETVGVTSLLASE